MEITFEIDPVPASRPRVSKYGTYYQDKYTQFRKDMGILLLGYKGGVISKPLKLKVIFNMPIPKSYSKKKSVALVGKYCATNIDLDNLEKALYDSMNEVVYEDDRQIVHHDVCKIWSKVGSIVVSIELAEN